MWDEKNQFRSRLVPSAPVFRAFEEKPCGSKRELDGEVKWDFRRGQNRGGQNDGDGGDEVGTHRFFSASGCYSVLLSATSGN